MHQANKSVRLLAGRGEMAICPLSVGGIQRRVRLGVIMVFFGLHLAMANGHCLSVGDTGRITIPIKGASVGGPVLTNVSVAIHNAPAWLNLLPDSLMGPVPIYPGEVYYFRIEYRIDMGFTPGQTFQMDVDIRTDTDRKSVV